MPHAPSLSTNSFNKSFSTSAEREEVSPCTCTVVLLGKGAISSVVHMLFFLCRQWRFRPRPLHALPRGSKAIAAAAKTLSAHAGPAHGVSASDSQSRSKNSDVPQYSGRLSGTTSHFLLTARPSLQTSATHVRLAGQENQAVAAKRSTLGQEKTTNNGKCRLACASLLHGLEGFDIRQWLGVRFPKFVEATTRYENPSCVSWPCATAMRQRFGDSQTRASECAETTA